MDISDNNKIIKKLIALILKIIIFIIIIFLIFNVVFGLKRANDINMIPNIKEGDLLLYYRLDKNYKIGDVVVCKIDGKEYVLRIAAKENQTVDISDDGNLMVDSYQNDNNVYYKTEKDKNSKISFPYKIKKGEYFLINDYRMSKNDSRIFGGISNKNILGKVITKLQVRNF